MKVIIDEEKLMMLRESLGVSDEVLNLSKELLSLIYKQYRNHQLQQTYDTIPVNDSYSIEYVKGFDLDLSGSQLEKMCSVTLMLYVYDPNEIDGKTALRALIDSHKYRAAYSTNKSIILSIVWPLTNQLDETYQSMLLGTLNHEVRHMFQDSHKNFKIDDRYSNAVRSSRNIPSDDLDSTLWLIDYYIPHVYYMFDPNEIESYVQEAYAEITNGNVNFGKSDTIKNIYTAISNYKYLINIYMSKSPFYQEKGVKEYVENSVREKIGCDIKHFLRYCNNGYNKYRKLLMKIAARWQSEGEGRDITGRQGSFKQYADNEVESCNMFVQPNNNGWLQKLMKLFRF